MIIIVHLAPAEHGGREFGYINLRRTRSVGGNGSGLFGRPFVILHHLSQCCGGASRVGARTSLQRALGIVRCILIPERGEQG